jgi:uncharacterized membrane protein YqgA involved in biofilm formation
MPVRILTAVTATAMGAIAGLRLSGIKRDIEVLNLLPALILAFFVSGIWTAILT